MVHMTFILPTFIFKHLSHHDTKACILAQNLHLNTIFLIVYTGLVKIMLTFKL